MIPIEHKFEFIREKGKMTGFHIGIYSPQILTQKNPAYKLIFTPPLITKPSTGA